MWPTLRWLEGRCGPPPSSTGGERINHSFVCSVMVRSIRVKGKEVEQRRWNLGCYSSLELSLPAGDWHVVFARQQGNLPRRFHEGDREPQSVKQKI